MELRELLEYQEIVVQCHDNPDADAIASGYALYCYLQSKGKNVSLVYGGHGIIRKSNLVLMIESLEIPIKYVSEIGMPELLITVDCQYGEGNVTRFEAQNVAVIDHHRVSGELPILNEVRTDLGACVTLIWNLLQEEGVDVNKNRKLSTAMYYGLYMDTTGFAEISHPLDKDFRDYAMFDKVVITKLRNANISLEELEIAGTALLRSDYVEENRFAIVKAGACDPNVLGIISDLVLAVDAIDVCLVFNLVANGVKLSVRSCIKEVRASELAAEITRGIGSGGGHHVKAGGFIPMKSMKEAYLQMCQKEGRTPRMVLNEDGTDENPSASAVKSLLEKRMVDYFADTEIIFANRYQADLEAMQVYVRRPAPIGYVMGTDLEPAGTIIKIRTAQGDSDIEITEDTVFLISNSGKVSVESKERFNMLYCCYPKWKFHLKSSVYPPTAKAKHSDKVVSLLSYSGVCILDQSMKVYAQELDHKIKLFHNESESTYAVGKKGDFLLVNPAKNNRLYVLNRKMFEREYKLENKENYVKRIDAVIFDLDGTLLDTLDDLRNSVNASLAEYGLPLRTLAEVRAFVGNGVRNLMIRAVPGGEDNPLFEDIFDCFKRHYSNHCNDMTGPYTDIMNLLKELDERKIRMGIVSNKLDPAVKELTDIYFGQYIQASVGETENVARKPEPDMVIRVMMELGVAPDHVLYVGDSDVDIQTAKNAGLQCISVTWGFRSEEFLVEHGAEHIIHEPMELLTYI